MAGQDHRDPGGLGPRPSRSQSRACCDQPDRALALGGVIATGDDVLASLAVGADSACIGSALIATEDARASASCKLCIVDRAVGQAHGQAYGQAHEQRIINSTLTARSA